jgi:hypothetical protein
MKEQNREKKHKKPFFRLKMKLIRMELLDPQRDVMRKSASNKKKIENFTVNSTER